jgi:actin-like ATPase involved in cell morphogenesis
MEKIKSIKIGFSYTKNLGNYNSIKISEELEIELQENDNLPEIKEIYYQNIKKSVKEQINEIIKKGNK